MVKVSFEKRKSCGEKRNLLILQVSRKLASGPFWLMSGGDSIPELLEHKQEC